MFYEAKSLGLLSLSGGGYELGEKKKFPEVKRKEGKQGKKKGEKLQNFTSDKS